MPPSFPALPEAFAAALDGRGALRVWFLSRGRGGRGSGREDRVVELAEAAGKGLVVARSWPANGTAALVAVPAAEPAVALLRERGALEVWGSTGVEAFALTPVVDAHEACHDGEAVLVRSASGELRRYPLPARSTLPSAQSELVATGIAYDATRSDNYYYLQTFFEILRNVADAFSPFFEVLFKILDFFK